VTLKVRNERWLELALPGSILDDELVTEELTSGLTTTFAFLVDPRGGRPKGGARIEIRYHLWDEAFHCLAVDAGGQREAKILPSREALKAWWRGLRLRSLDLGSQTTARTRASQVRVTLDVIPFSSKEEEDTQRWLGEVLAQDRDAPREIGAEGRTGGAVNQVFNVLIATSIRRKAVTSYRWTLQIPSGSSP